MNILENRNGETLEIALEGRLDTITSPELEKALSKALEGVTDFVMNFSELKYVSSAGLRIILSAQKRMNKQGKMLIKNVSEEIMEVFDMTGFSDILNIE
jgi:anti-sigma B factor antagonist